MLHPLNIRKHFHVNVGKLGGRLTTLRIFRTREDANKFARQTAAKEAKISGQSFRGGSFGNTSLAFYAIDNKCVEVKKCEEPGYKHRPS